MDRLICFSHGKESGPEGFKIQRLSKIAGLHGFEVHSIDYRGITSPDERVLKLISETGDKKYSILAGSSMGAYVAAVASKILKPDGLFLMAPAIHLAGYNVHEPELWGYAHIVHGWRDELIPASTVIEYAGNQKVPITLLDTGHNMHSAIAELEKLFEGFLLIIKDQLKKESY